jgi:two-component system sensor histidine kinase DesK
VTDGRSAHGFWFGAFEDSGAGRLACGSLALAFLGFPLADLRGDGLSGIGDGAAAAGLVAFALLFLRLLWILPWAGRERRAESAVLLAALATLAIALAIGRGDEWGGLIVYVSVAGALALPIRIALAGVGATALAGLAVGGGLDSGSGLALQALMFGLLVLGVRRLIELVTSWRRRANGSPSSRWARSACGYRASCTICSATTSR